MENLSANDIEITEDNSIIETLKKRNFKYSHECLEFCLIAGFSVKQACEFIRKFELKMGERYLDEPHLKTYVKTWENVADILGIKNLPDFSSFPKEDRLIELTSWKLKKIIKLFNNNWIKDWNNPNEYYYIPYFDLSNNSFSYLSYYGWNTNSSVGFSWGFKSKELMLFVVDKFLKDYEIVFKGK